jgi:hypothetical protein
MELVVCGLRRAIDIRAEAFEACLEYHRESTAKMLRRDAGNVVCNGSRQPFGITPNCCCTDYGLSDGGSGGVNKAAHMHTNIVDLVKALVVVCELVFR